VTLTCKVCGDDERTIAPVETLPETRLVREVLDVIGIEFGALVPERNVPSLAGRSRHAPCRRIRPERRREHRREDRLDSQHRLCATHFASTS
jgi:hypothetical protein